jgi:ABC-type Fe3+-siderophore transport system permease subunit
MRAWAIGAGVGVLLGAALSGAWTPHLATINGLTWIDAFNFGYNSITWISLLLAGVVVGGICGAVISFIASRAKKSGR